MMALLGDQPFVTVGIIDALLAAFRTDPTRITAAAVKGRRTLPVIFPRALFSELAKVEADRGGREVIARNPSRVVTIEFGATYEDLDVDTAEDFEKARRYLETLTDT
jgi:molybdenum cofactor cytidylyltransferase